jgi:TatD DNase family protein
MNSATQKFELIDIGANLAHDSFDNDREALIQRALDAGVKTIIVTGSTAQSSRDALELAWQYPGTLYATAGVHPHYAKDYTNDTGETLSELLVHDEVVAAGECGLDYFRNFSTQDDQERAFESLLEIAVNHRVPVFLHQRDAHDRFVEILKKHLDRIPRAVAHCFTGTENELAELIDLDLYIGITGWICDERRGHHLRDLVGRIPADRLMIETDAPYLLPRDLDPKPKTRRNEPMYLPHILHTIATATAVDEADLARQTTENARRFFELP